MSAKVSQGRQELAVVEREIGKLVRAIKDGVSATSIKKELLALEARQAELQQKLEAPELPELLHPRMADAYREKVAKLCQALEHEDSRVGATNAIRESIEAILLEPDGEQLNHPEGRPGGNAWRSQKTARGRRTQTTSWSNSAGCGGVQPAVLSSGAGRSSCRTSAIRLDDYSLPALFRPASRDDS
jgi:hypothetical protein